MPPSNTDLWRAARQVRLAYAINLVAEDVWKVYAEVLREISVLGVCCEEDKTAVSVLAAAVHDDAAWDAVTQVRQCIEALRSVHKDKS